MRRSKSNPAKYARNYKRISQRQMTKYDGLDEEKEMQRLKNILKHSEEHLQKNVADDGDDDNRGSRKKQQENTKKRKVSEDDTAEKDTSNNKKSAEEMTFEEARAMLRNSADHIKPANNTDDVAEANDDAMLLKPLRKGKKRNRKSGQNESEFRTNKGDDKMASADEKETSETDLTADTNGNKNKSKNDASHLVSEEFMSEHFSNPTLAESTENPLVVLPKNKKTKQNKKPKVELTPEEIRQAKQLQKKTQRKLKQLTVRAEQKQKRAKLYEKLQKTAIGAEEMALLSSSSTLGKRVSKKEQLKKLVQKERAGLELTEEERELLYRDHQTGSEQDFDNEHSAAAVATDNDNKPNGGPHKEKKQKKDTEDDDDDTANESVNDATEKESAANSFAAQMMASLSNLKATSEKQKEENEKKKHEEEEERQRKEEERVSKLAKKAPYRPQEPIVIQTAATNKKLQVHKLPTSDRRVLTVKRPEAVQESRYDLPVTQMEFEVIDAIRNHDVTIICGETGSG